jgi:hydroxymethylbilane synthase
MTLPDRPLRLGTRASPLALAQAEAAKAALLAAHDVDVEIVALTATGDRILDRPLAEVGGKALWTKELDAALLADEVDFAVHSMKDVETERPEAFAIAAMLPRADVRDRIVGAESIDALPTGAIFGTSAPRRTAQMLRLRPDFKITLFRGNVQTRLRKLAEMEADATLLAAAGLDRLGLDDVGTPVSVEQLLPAPAQGAIGIECLANADVVRALLASINHAPTFDCVSAERALLAGLNAGCRSPVAALATKDGAHIHLRAELFSPDGTDHVAGETRFEAGDRDAPYKLAADLLAEAPPAIRAVFG